MKATIVLFCLLNFSCGIKGPPLPPLKDDVVQKQKSELVTVNTTENPASLASADNSAPAKTKKRKVKK